MDKNIDSVTLFWMSYYGPILTALMISVILIFYYRRRVRAGLLKSAFTDQHVVITGGSSGIGKSVAIQVAKRGANVTIIARDPIKLNAAKEEIFMNCISPLQRVFTISLDVSKDEEAVTKALADAEEGSGPIFMLVNCAGQAVCGKIEDLSADNFKFMMDLNYYGTVFPTKAVVSGMKMRRRGHIVITASQAAMIGIYGFTAYSASKFALRGFAEALDMELRSYGVQVTVCLPPDTDTPGFAEEEKNKPMETRLISQTSGLVSPDVVASQLLSDAIDGKFFSTVGFEGFLLTTGCAGMAPLSSYCELCSEVLLMGLIRLISVFYLWSFQGIIRKCKRNKNQAKKSE